MKTKIIAEAGLNHNGNYENAKKLIKIAKDSGSDFVKFQLFKTEELFNSKLNPQYKKIFKNFKKREFTFNQWKNLINYSKKIRIKLFFSVFDNKSIDTLKNLKLNIVKIPSGEITNLELLKQINKRQFKVILSTGMATIHEIKKAVNILKDCEVIILHCVSEYPAQRSNLSFINFLKREFPKNQVGLSDHSKEIYTPAMSLYHGANYIEKHFTFNKNIKLGDHHMSLDPFELKSMVELIRYTEKNLKRKKMKIISNKERNLKKLARKAIYLSKNKKKNETLELKDIKFLRPQIGINSEKLNLIVKKKFTRDVKAYVPLSLSMFKR